MVHKITYLSSIDVSLKLGYDTNRYNLDIRMIIRIIRVNNGKWKNGKKG